MFYAAEVIPVVGGVVSGGSDGVLTVSAGRAAKAAFLHLPEGPADPPADHPSVLLEVRARSALTLS
jgi:hypothetical protein